MATKKETTKKEKNVKVEEVVKVEETVKVEKPKVKKTKSQLMNEIKLNENTITVEILNIGVGSVSYMTKLGTSYFDLDLGESDIVPLAYIKDVCKKSIGFFKDFAITITDIFLNGVEDVTKEDVIAYLGLDRVYKDIENYDTDFLKEFILYSDDYEFEKELRRKSSYHVKMIACKMIQLYQDGEDITREKENIICDLLNVDKLNMNK